LSKITKLVFLFFIIHPLHAQDFSEIDINLDNLSFQKTIIPLQRLNNTFPKNIEVLVRLSAAHHFLSEETNDKKIEKLNMDKALSYIIEAMSIDSTNAEVHKWYAVSYGKSVENQSIRKQIESSKIIQFHCLQAIEKLPNDPFCYNIMGQWHYRLADISPLSRSLATIIFEEPPKGSFEMAEYFLNKSLELEPDYIGTYYWLGKTYNKLDRPNKTLSLFKIAIDLPRPYKREELMYKDIVKQLKKNKS
jgi:tetratricopeptide (TPR) repeat protein